MKIREMGFTYVEWRIGRRKNSSVEGMGGKKDKRKGGRVSKASYS